MTLAKRVAPIIRLGADGLILGAYERGGMQVPHLEAVARYHEADGADEIWLHLIEPDERGAAALFDPVKAVRERVRIPLVAWGAIRSSADARLLVGLGADRVVVDEADEAIDDVMGAIRDIATAVGSASVAVALITQRRVRDLDGGFTSGSVAWEICGADGTALDADALTVAQAVCQVGAGELVLRPWLHGASVAHDAELVDRLLALSAQQVVSVGLDEEAEDLAPALLTGADGVASETLFASGAHTVLSVKNKLAEFGINLRPAQAPYARTT